MQVVVGRSINMAISARGRDGLKGIGCEELITSKGIEMHSRMIHDLKGNMSPVQYDSKGRSIISIDRRLINELLLTGNCYFALGLKLNFTIILIFRG